MVPDFSVWNISWNFEKKIGEHRKQRTFYQVFWIQEKKFNSFILRKSTFNRGFISSHKTRSLGLGLLGASCVTPEHADQFLWTQLLHLTSGGIIPLMGIEVFSKHRSKVSRSQKLNYVTKTIPENRLNKKDKCRKGTVDDKKARERKKEE